MTDQELLAISKCSLFKSVKLAEIKLLFLTTPYTIKHYEKNAVVLVRGDKYENLIIVLKGELDTEINDISGRTIKIEKIKSSSIAASAILFASDPSIPVTLTVSPLSSAKLLFLPPEAVLKLFRNSEIILKNYLKDTGDKINLLAEKIKLFKFSNLRQKTAGYILDLSEKQKAESITLPYTKEIIAEIFGVTRPSLSRVFSELSKEKTIKQQGRSLKIINRPALMQILKNSSFN
ncbi:MAG: Crp/Fnr family transcriptional regulator [Spirochaetia bacterium]|nr:Crp/Fnr family transcriptional regulator [Spirochaetia bacterium]